MAHHFSVDPECLKAAQTWFAAGDYHKALEELDRLDATLRDHPDVLEMRCQIGSMTNDWKLSLEAASRLMRKDPDRPSGWIQRSIALQHLNCGQEAALLLKSAVEKFPKDWLIPYHLARLACISGQSEQTWHWFVMALGTGDSKKIRDLAMSDPDLKPFLTRILKKK
jgi:predicted Zn-dependent protease